jgi:Uncharacterized protein related to proFAR isomerase (HisA)
MLVIPVLDLRGSVVVHARAGERASYRPVCSALSVSADPVEVAGAYLNLCSFPTLYIADLDAILKQGNNVAHIRRLRDHFPELSLWVDAGFDSAASLQAWTLLELGAPVLGSETHRDFAALKKLLTKNRPGDLILSLDFHGDHFLGPPGLLESPALWPDRVIAMSLHRVGVQQGPDLNLWQRLRQMQPDGQIFVAGGVRDVTDLTRLRDLGASGALLASALHAGRLSSHELRVFMSANI